MATQNHTTQTTAQRLREAEANRDQAYNDNTTLWAIAKLGDLLSEAQDHHGFDGLTDNHWSAIGVAINRMADHLCSKQGNEAERLENIAGELYDQHEKEQKRQRRLNSELSERQLSQVCGFLERFNAGDLTMDNIQNIREICPDLEQETAEKFLAILTDGKAVDTPELSVVS
ncbi:hypothetical protein [Porticoccus sp.]